MRCSQCSHKEKNAFKRCAHCGHEAVADVKVDGIGDPGLKKATAKLAHEDTVYFLPTHLGYEILRIFHHKGAGLSRPLKVSMTMLLTGIVFWLADSLFAACIVGGIGLLLSLAKAPRPDNVFTLAEQFLTVNPHPFLVPNEVPEETLKVDFKRLLVCDHTVFKDFLCANQWPLRNACAVIGPDTPARLLPTNVTHVFILHDLTPNGLMFAQQVVSDWSSTRPAVDLLDLGLFPDQQTLFANFLQPLDNIHDAGLGIVGGLPEGLGIDLSVFRPGLMLSLLSKSLEAEKPLGRTGEEDDSGTGGFSVESGADE